MTSSFDRAQARYDAQEPPEPTMCAPDEHEIDWHSLRPAVNEAGIVYVECSICGSESWAAIEARNLQEWQI